MSEDQEFHASAPGAFAPANPYPAETSDLLFGVGFDIYFEIDARAHREIRLALTGLISGDETPSRPGEQGSPNTPAGETMPVVSIEVFQKTARFRIEVEKHGLTAWASARIRNVRRGVSAPLGFKIPAAFWLAMYDNLKSTKSYYTAVQYWGVRKQAKIARLMRISRSGVLRKPAPSTRYAVLNAEPFTALDWSFFGSDQIQRAGYTGIDQLDDAKPSGAALPMDLSEPSLDDEIRIIDGPSDLAWALTRMSSYSKTCIDVCRNAVWARHSEHGWFRTALRGFEGIEFALTKQAAQLFARAIRRIHVRPCTFACDGEIAVVGSPYAGAAQVMTEGERFLPIQEFEWPIFKKATMRDGYKQQDWLSLVNWLAKEEERRKARERHRHEVAQQPRDFVMRLHFLGSDRSEMNWTAELVRSEMKGETQCDLYDVDPEGNLTPATTDYSVNITAICFMMLVHLFEPGKDIDLNFTANKIDGSIVKLNWVNDTRNIEFLARITRMNPWDRADLDTFPNMSSRGLRTISSH